MIQYKEKPFYLDDEDIQWVERTLSSMTLDEKIGQMFCVTDMITDPEALKSFIEKYRPGGFMYRSGDGAEIQNAHRVMQEASKIPLLFLTVQRIGNPLCGFFSETTIPRQFIEHGCRP